jgi:hypothetical protein
MQLLLVSFAGSSIATGSLSAHTLAVILVPLQSPALGIGDN